MKFIKMTKKEQEQQERLEWNNKRESLRHILEEKLKGVPTIDKDAFICGFWTAVDIL